MCIFFALIVGHVAWDSWWRLGISTLLGISLVFRSERSTTYPSGPPKSPQSERFSEHSKHSKRTRRSSPAKLRTQNLNLVRQILSRAPVLKKKKCHDCNYILWPCHNTEQMNLQSFKVTICEKNVYKSMCVYNILIIFSVCVVQMNNPVNKYLLVLLNMSQGRETR